MFTASPVMHTSSFSESPASMTDAQPAAARPSSRLAVEQVTNLNDVSHDNASVSSTPQRDQTPVRVFTPPNAGLENSNSNNEPMSPTHARLSQVADRASEVASAIVTDDPATPAAAEDSSASVAAPPVYPGGSSTSSESGAVKKGGLNKQLSAVVEEEENTLMNQSIESVEATDNAASKKANKVKKVKKVKKTVEVPALSLDGMSLGDLIKTVLTGLQSQIEVKYYIITLCYC